MNFTKFAITKSSAETNLLKQKLFINLAGRKNLAQILKNMLDLKNLGVVELNAQEQISIDGGLWLELLLLVVGIVVGLLIT